ELCSEKSQGSRSYAPRKSKGRGAVLREKPRVEELYSEKSQGSRSCAPRKAKGRGAMLREKQ
ncbi:MAG: hypothetical protein ACI819_002685, partial [Neolewinella sp.]